MFFVAANLDFWLHSEVWTKMIGLVEDYSRRNISVKLLSKYLQCDSK